MARLQSNGSSTRRAARSVGGQCPPYSGRRRPDWLKAHGTRNTANGSRPPWRLPLIVRLCWLPARFDFSTLERFDFWTLGRLDFWTFPRPPCRRSATPLELRPFGDVAQLGERLVRNEQVEGSNPFVSSRAGIPCYLSSEFANLCQQSFFNVPVLKAGESTARAESITPAPPAPHECREAAAPTRSRPPRTSTRRGRSPIAR